MTTMKRSAGWAVGLAVLLVGSGCGQNKFQQEVETEKVAVKLARQMAEGEYELITTAELKALLDKRNGELAAVQKTEAEKKTALTAAQQVLATAQKTAADKQAAVAGTQKAIAEATEALKPLQQAAAVARKAADDAKATTEAARKAVDAMVAESAPAGDKG